VYALHTKKHKAMHETHKKSFVLIIQTALNPDTGKLPVRVVLCRAELR